MDFIKNAIKTFPTGNDLFQAAADDFAARTFQVIQKKGICNVVLSGGNTPKKFFDVLVTRTNIHWDKIRFFFGDERYVPMDDQQSNYHTAQQFLFSKVPVSKENIYPIPTQLTTAVASAEEYVRILRTFFNGQWPEFDITYLGMGDNGHTASLMPHTDLVKNYIRDPDLPSWVEGIWVEKLNMYRITLTPPAINHSAYIAFLVEGEAKAAPLKEVLNKTDPLQYPAILIKNAVWFVDKAAASQL